MARDLSGTSQYVLFPTSPSSGNLTACLWIFCDDWNFANGEGYHGIFVKGAWGTNGDGDLSFYVDPSGNLHFDVFTSAGGTGVLVAGDRSGAWHHICGTYDDSTDTVKLYIDGVEVAITTHSGTRGTNTRNICLGAFDSALTTTEFDGKLAEAAIWNNVLLTPEAIAGLAKGFSPLLYRRGLSFYAPLIGKATSEPNLVGSVASTTLGSASEHPRIYYPASYNIGFGAASGYEPPGEDKVRSTAEFYEGAYREAIDSHARVTAEFEELSYRDPLRASDALVTAEFYEGAYREPLATGLLLTAQVVEVLLLLPEQPEIPFDECGNFTGIREWEARLFTSAGKRKSLGPAAGISDTGVCPPAARDWTDAIESVSFELTERGGFGSGSVSLLEEWQRIGLDGTEYVDIYLFDTLVYRGWIHIVEKSVADDQRATVTLYGLMNWLNQFSVRRPYAYGSERDDLYTCSQDVSTVFRAIIEDEVKISGRFPNVVIDTEVIGVPVKHFDARGKSVSAAINELCDLSPNAMRWGATVDALGNDVLFLKRRATITRYGFAVGDNVSALVHPKDTGSIVNKLRLKGGAVRQPNLLGNPSFEEIAGTDDVVGNLLLDYSFEFDNAGGNWTLSGGATIKNPSIGATAAGAARTGNRWLELDSAGESGEQTVRIDYTKTYRAFFWTRREVNANARPIALTVEFLNSVGAIVATPYAESFTSPGSDIYELRQAIVTAQSYPTVTHLRIRASVDGGTASNDGALVDDAAVVESCAAAQEGWRSWLYGAAYFTTLDWANEEIDAKHGAYSLKLEVAGISSGSDVADIYTPASNYVDVNPNDRYTLGVWVQTNSEGAASFKLGVTRITSEGVEESTEESLEQVIDTGTWTLFTLDLMTKANTAQLKVFFRITDNCKVWFDAALVVQGSVPDEIVYNDGYWPSDTYERTFRTDDSILAALVDAPVLTSITDYRLRDADATNERVKNLASAKAFAAGYFNAHAVANVIGRLSLRGIRRFVDLDGKVRVANLPAAPDDMVPVRVRYTIGDSVDADIDLNDDYPEFALLLQQTNA